MVALHRNGLSHGKVAEFSGDAPKCPVSRSTYRRVKMSPGDRLSPERDGIAGDILRSHCSTATNCGGPSRAAAAGR